MVTAPLRTTDLHPRPPAAAPLRNGKARKLDSDPIPAPVASFALREGRYKLNAVTVR